MFHIAHILVPYDFSPFSKQALISALHLGRLKKADIHLVHIELIHGAPLMDSSTAEPSIGWFRKRVEEENEDIWPLFEDATIHYRLGRDVAPGPSILHYANENEIDLIIIGTHGRRGVRRMFLGSVAEEIVRHATCPVITVHKDESIQLDQLKRILVPIDFSKHSEQALAHAIELASISGAVLDLIHVVHLPSYPTLNDVGIFSLYQYQPGLEEKALKHLALLWERFADSNIEVTFNVFDGQPGDEIVRFALEHKSDLIVMGTHGLTGLSHFLLGSIAAKTIRKAPCPMFIVKSFGKFLIDARPEMESEEAATQT